MLELRRLKYMSVPAEELHFGKVAEGLGIAQPALTQHVQALERELGVELSIGQKGRSSSPSPAGSH